MSKVTDTIAKAAGRKKVGKKKAAKKPKLTNHIAIIVDRSWSMGGWERQVVNTVNEQLSNLRAVDAGEDQETLVTLRTFSSYVDSPEAFAIDIKEVDDWAIDDYTTGGSTALNDSIGYTIRDLKRVKGANNKNTSFLLIVVTDGEENSSDEFTSRAIKNKIAEVQATDRWSVVCLVPPNHKSIVTRNLGVPPGNVREWEQSEAGFEDMSRNVGAGLQSYYVDRAAGATRTTAFFVDADHIDETDLDDLVDVSGDYYVWTVDRKNARAGTKDGHVRIDDYVNGRINSNARVRKQVGSHYQLGRGFYELTKSELIQERKGVVIQHLDTGKMYGGKQARGLLGITPGARMRIRPGQLDGYRIFVESTSPNRNLVDKTKFLYSKN